jgi:hypothetical protein
LDVVKDVSDFSGEHFGLALDIVRDVSGLFSVEHFRFALDIVRDVNGFSGKHRSRYPENRRRYQGKIYIEKTDM